ncbi:MAG: PqqD family protein [Acidimicrobiales bacterium]
MATRRRTGVSFEPSGDSVVILNADGTEMTTLNPVGSLIWQALDGERDASALAQDLVTQFEDVAVDELERDIADFIEDLAAADLVDIS